ncbi:MAG: T9SS type A sorting domain-containing protein [Chitinophagales bacterium]|nr:T9SS type A sorting domain-containing protein [Chitinophagales bacterium]MBP8754721.1 T9SS type A sorting domain-containing protein [Chitinophagales bacterium]MBP9705459.1 T9SS type A sorting domain-containing protein [Chitinophagales bacterium]
MKNTTLQLTSFYYRIFFVASFLLLQSFISYSQTSGVLDITFGDTGTFTTAFGPQYDVPQGLIIQPDGKIVVSGTAGTIDGTVTNLVLIRLNPDGTYDTSFGEDGIASVDLGISQFVEQSIPLAIQDDGKLVTVLHKKNGDYYDYAAIRFNTDGTLDTSFDGDGIAEQDVFYQNDFPTAVAIQSNGKILVYGTGTSGSFYKIGLVRFNSDGSLDESFSIDGQFIYDFGYGDNSSSDVHVLPDGKIMLAGYAAMDGTSRDVFAIKLNEDGSFDTSFGEDGIAVFAISVYFDFCGSSFIKEDGKILFCGSITPGSGDYDPFALQINADGTMDTSFGTDGITVIDLGDRPDYGRFITEQSDGKILITGYNDQFDTIKCVVIRLNEDGSLDNTFGTEGKTIFSTGNPDYRGEAMAIQNDGKILVTGWNRAGTIGGGGLSFEWSVSRFTTSTPVAIQSINELSITLYPNPVSDNLIIQVPDVNTKYTLQIVNSNGELISEQIINHTSYKTISVQHLPSGFYFLQLKNENENYVMPFQKL